MLIVCLSIVSLWIALIDKLAYFGESPIMAMIVAKMTIATTTVAESNTITPTMNVLILM